MQRRKRSIENARDLRARATDAERRLWRELRSKRFESVKFRRQHGIGVYLVDFCAPSHWLIIEVDGGQHQAESAEYDGRRTRRLEQLGWKVIRFWNHDVLERSDAVLERIQRALRDPSPSPGLRPASPQKGEANPSPLPLGRGRAPARVRGGSAE